MKKWNSTSGKIKYKNFQKTLEILAPFFYNIHVKVFLKAKNSS